MQAIKAAAKEITILKRAEVKKASTSYAVNPGDLVFLVKGNTGNVYVTTLRNNGEHTCTCKSTRKCYHIKGCEKVTSARIEAAKVATPEVVETVESIKEKEWTAYRIALAKKLAQQYVTTQIVEQLAEAMVTPKASKVAKVIEQAVQATVPVAKSTDLTNKGNLNGQRGYALMR